MSGQHGLNLLDAEGIECYRHTPRPSRPVDR